jgi:hypothetical protein
MLPFQSKTDAKLAAEIGDAVKAYDAADATRKEKAIIAGRLLVEARERHPSKMDFEIFLELAGGVGIRRAETFIAIALGRKEFEQHQIDNAAAQQRHRDKLKAEKIEKEKAKAALPGPDDLAARRAASAAEIAAGLDEWCEHSAPEPKPAPDALRNAQTPRQISIENRRLFEAACRFYLPLLSKSDLSQARTFVTLGLWRVPKQKKQEAA